MTENTNGAIQNEWVEDVKADVRTLSDAADGNPASLLKACCESPARRVPIPDDPMREWAFVSARGRCRLPIVVR
ncbi:MAG: hypothetical protein SNJ76_13180, partial [Fimbriimonadaceae bacterium]